MNLSRGLRENLKTRVHGLFAFGQRLGVDILPRHFYSSIPDLGELQREESWKLPSSMTGVAGADIKSQVSFLRACCPEPLPQRLRRDSVHDYACRANGVEGYGPVEAEFLFCFIATKRPKRIVQVGCGVSTAVILLAAEEAGYTPQITCIEPFPGKYLTDASENKRIELVPVAAQTVNLDVFTHLTAGDLLFIDSSHAVRAGGEVNRIILEVLPRMPAGVIVHFHDIYFPYDYASQLMTTLFFGGESTLLHAFLINNARYSIAISLSMLHHACPEELKKFLPDYRPAPMQHGLHTTGRGHFPSATYLSIQ